MYVRICLKPGALQFVDFTVPEPFNFLEFAQEIQTMGCFVTDHFLIARDEIQAMMLMPGEAPANNFQVLHDVPTETKQ